MAAATENRWICRAIRARKCSRRDGCAKKPIRGWGKAAKGRSHVRPSISSRSARSSPRCWEIFFGRHAVSSFDRRAGGDPRQGRRPSNSMSHPRAASRPRKIRNRAARRGGRRSASMRKPAAGPYRTADRSRPSAPPSLAEIDGTLTEVYRSNPAPGRTIARAALPPRRRGTGRLNPPGRRPPAAGDPGRPRNSSAGWPSTIVHLPRHAPNNTASTAKGRPTPNSVPARPPPAIGNPRGQGLPFPLRAGTDYVEMDRAASGVRSAEPDPLMVTKGPMYGTRRAPAAAPTWITSAVQASTARAARCRARLRIVGAVHLDGARHPPHSEVAADSAARSAK